MGVKIMNSVSRKGLTVTM